MKQYTVITLMPNGQQLVAWGYESEHAAKENIANRRRSAEHMPDEHKPIGFIVVDSDGACMWVNRHGEWLKTVGF